MPLTVEKLMGMLSSAFIPNNATYGILVLDKRCKIIIMSASPSRGSGLPRSIIQL